MGTSLRRIQQAGFTALELIIVLIVGLSVIALAASRMDVLFAKSAVAEELTNIQTIYMGARAMRGTGGYGNSAMNQALIQASAVPRSMPTDTSSWKITSSSNSQMEMVVTGALNNFKIEYKQIPRALCTDLIVQTAKTGAFSDIAGISGAALTTLTPAVAASQCGRANNDITWTSMS